MQIFFQHCCRFTVYQKGKYMNFFGYQEKYHPLQEKKTSYISISSCYKTGIVLIQICCFTPLKSEIHIFDIVISIMFFKYTWKLDQL